MARKIGILGGTFNPIHNGHLALGQAAFNQLWLDSIWFMPSSQTNLKKEKYILPAIHRIELIKLALEKHPHFALSEIEIQRAGITYTFETLLQLERMYPEDEFYFIMGSDCLFSIEKWKEPAVIMQKSSLVVAIREEEEDRKIINTQVIHLKDKYGAKIYLLDFPSIPISSTEIRARITKNEPVTDLIPLNVEEYIKEHFLFIGMDNI